MKGVWSLALWLKMNTNSFYLQIICFNHFHNFTKNISCEEAIQPFLGGLFRRKSQAIVIARSSSLSWWSKTLILPITQTVLRYQQQPWNMCST